VLRRAAYTAARRCPFARRARTKDKRALLVARRLARAGAPPLDSRWRFPPGSASAHCDCSCQSGGAACSSVGALVYQLHRSISALRAQARCDWS